MPALSANHIFSPSSWLNNHVLEVSEEGQVQALRPKRVGEKVQNLGAYLVPGFVNAHTHLELAHLKYEIPEGTGMSGFAWEVVKSRRGEEHYPLQKRRKKIEKSLERAWEEGVQGFGDIANEDITAEIKDKWSEFFHFHTFVEMIGLNGKMAPTILEKGKELRKKFDSASITLHAPYSVSSTLRNLVYQTEGPFSIHMLESEEEKEVFEKGRGAMVDFFMRLGIDFIGMGAKNPLDYLLEGHPGNKKSIWVHLKEASVAELEILAALEDTFFCLCPRSNVYIHRNGPDISRFLPYSDRICLGTDSLASNYDLSIWEEVKWIQDAYPQVDFHKLIRWASYNGAKALAFGSLGEFQVGMEPGILVIDEKREQCQRLF